jgi:hypothetical protein
MVSTLTQACTPTRRSAAAPQRRSATHGANELAASQDRPWWHLLADQFKDFMVLVMLGAAVISGLVGEVTDTLVILVIVVLNAVIGFVQAWRADQAMAALRLLAAAHATVLRGGEVQAQQGRGQEWCGEDAGAAAGPVWGGLHGRPMMGATDGARQTRSLGFRRRRRFVTPNSRDVAVRFGPRVRSLGGSAALAACQLPCSASQRSVSMAGKTNPGPMSGWA